MSLMKTIAIVILLMVIIAQQVYMSMNIKWIKNRMMNKFERVVSDKVFTTVREKPDVLSNEKGKQELMAEVISAVAGDKCALKYKKECKRRVEEGDYYSEGHCMRDICFYE